MGMRTDRDGEGRRRRKPLGTTEQKLARPHNKGFVRRWLNDTPGRVERAKEAGYRHVRTDDGEKSPEVAVVGVSEDGSPLHAYLMEIPEKYYKEDQLEKERPLAEFDKVLKRGNITGADPKDTESYYVPDEGISVKTGS